jgi:hypothetical protein
MATSATSSVQSSQNLPPKADGHTQRYEQLKKACVAEMPVYRELNSNIAKYTADIRFLRKGVELASQDKWPGEVSSETVHKFTELLKTLGKQFDNLIELEKDLVRGSNFLKTPPFSATDLDTLVQQEHATAVHTNEVCTGYLKEINRYLSNAALLRMMMELSSPEMHRQARLLEAAVESNRNLQNPQYVAPPSVLTDPLGYFKNIVWGPSSETASTDDGATPEPVTGSTARRGSPTSESTSSSSSSASVTKSLKRTDKKERKGSGAEGANQ